MFKRTRAAVGEIASHITLWQAFGLGGVVSGAGTTAAFAHFTKWLDQYGPLGWWYAILIGSLLGLLLALAVAWLRYALVLGGAIRKWKEAVDQINPLDNEFTGKRIKIQDLVNPATGRVMLKKFINCELMGLVNIAFTGDSLTGTGFINCDMICVKPNAVLHNSVLFQDVAILGGALYGCTIFVTNEMIPQLMNIPGVYFSTRTSDPDLDNINPPTTHATTR